jgi:hypothetical protein
MILQVLEFDAFFEQMRREFYIRYFDTHLGRKSEAGCLLFMGIGGVSRVGMIAGVLAV